MSDTEKLLGRLGDLSRLSDGWDGEGSVSINKEIVEFTRRVIRLAKESVLKGWLVFPDSRGYLYLDYTNGKDIAGMTIAVQGMTAFVKRNGILRKYTYSKLDEKDVLNLLEEVHGKINVGNCR